MKFSHEGYTNISSIGKNLYIADHDKIYDDLIIQALKNDLKSKYTQETINDINNDRQNKVIIYAINGKEIGSCECNLKTKEIMHLFISESYRNKGYAKEILKVAIDRFKCNNLFVYKDNTSAYQLYTKLGFKVYKEDNEFYYMNIDSIATEAFYDFKNIMNIEMLAPKKDCNILFAPFVNDTIISEVVQDNMFNDIEYINIDDILDNKSYQTITQIIGNIKNFNIKINDYHNDTMTEDDYWSFFSDLVTSILEYSNKNTNILHIIIGRRLISCFSLYGYAFRYKPCIYMSDKALNDILYEAKDTNFLSAIIIALRNRRKNKSRFINMLEYKNKIIGKKKLDNMNLMHISINGELTEFSPTIPDSINGLENVGTKRSCFAPSINKCLAAIAQDRIKDNTKMYIYYPIIEEDTKGYAPSKKEVSDVDETKEIWILTKVKLKKIGHVIFSVDGTHVKYVVTQYNHDDKDIILESNYIDNTTYEPVFEAATYDSTHKHAVYIVLMHSGTALANTIKKFTKDQYSHACIAFEPSLNKLYSFGRKKLDLSSTGFAITKPSDDFFKKFTASYGVYVMFVTADEYHKMQDRIEYFIEHDKDFKYDIFGLLLNALHLESEHEKKYFCSRFVAEILRAGIDMNKPSSMYRPQDLSYLDNISLVNSGDDFSHYRYKDTIKSVNSLIYKGGN